MGLGANEVEVLPVRAGKGDLVAVTASDDGLLWIYDDDQEALVRVIGRDPATGIPLLGRQPFGLVATRRWCVCPAVRLLLQGRVRDARRRPARRAVDDGGPARGPADSG